MIYISLIISLVVAIFLGLSVVLTILWNWLMPTIFGLPQVGFWQAVGLMLLSTLLFGSRTITNKRG